MRIIPGPVRRPGVAVLPPVLDQPLEDGQHVERVLGADLSAAVGAAEEVLLALGLGRLEPGGAGGAA